jgi:hypothetical protein
MSDSREFFRCRIEGVQFKAVMNVEGPYIVRVTPVTSSDGKVLLGGGVALGSHAAIACLRPGDGMEQVAGWWIVAHGVSRISLDGVSEKGRAELSRSFGIQIADTQMTKAEYRRLFLESDAYRGLFRWAASHPRLVKKYENVPCDIPWTSYIRHAQRGA